ncbi:hypothetical protein ABTH20_20760, partial [Acinetobacter baumannii]
TMNRYSLWKYALIVLALLFGVIYTVPNFFGESPAVQISSAKSTLKVEPAVAGRVDQILKQGNLGAESVAFDNAGSQPSVRARFA